MVICLICARKNSKRLPGKNLKKINQTSLLAHSILMAKSCVEIDKVFVSTDCYKIAEEGEKYGAIIPFIRPSSLAKDNTPEWKVWQHFLKFYNKKNAPPKSLVILPATAPLRKLENVKSALNIFNNNKCDGVISVTDCYKNPSFNIVKTNIKGYAELAIPLKKQVHRTQDAELYYDITTVCYVMNPEYVQKNNYLFDGKIKLNHIPREDAADIDTKLDLDWAKFVFKSRNIE